MLFFKKNVKNLMINKETRLAIENKRFHVWAVDTVEEAFELITGLECGVWNERKQAFPPKTAFAIIDKALHPPEEKIKKSVKKKTRIQGSVQRAVSSQRSKG